MPNKFAATWISHSSISDFLKCPKAYYYRNVYKNPDSNKKISIVGEYLSLGVAVHEVVEKRAELPKETRLDVDFKQEFLKEFEPFRGEKGGFKSLDSEKDFENRGLSLMDNIQNNPGPLARPLVKLLKDRKDLPWVWVCEKEEIITSGKTDLIEWEEDGLVPIDLKTSAKNSEKADSLQLPIYSILIDHFKTKKAKKGAYWYPAQGPDLVYKDLPPVKESLDKLLSLGQAIKEARKAKEFKCPYNGCWSCRDYERVLKGEGKFIGLGSFGAEQYFLK